MAALTRPDLPPGPRRELSDALRDLHHAAGWPSLRAIARAVGVSPTTVSAVFSSPRTPAWGLVELVVESLGGDVEEFRRLWLAASTPVGDPVPDRALIAGRRDELARLRRHLTTGSGLLLITGEAGIGKTRLVETARRTTDVFVARGAGLPLSAAVPLLPLATALRAVHAVDRGLWLKEALVDTAPYVRATLATLLPELESPSLPPTDGGTVRRQMSDAIATTMGALAELRPLALLVDDLHWADVATLELVEQLVSVGISLPVVGTFRIDDPAVAAPTLDWLLRVRRVPAVEEIELAPLSRAETAEQLTLLEPHRPITAADRIYQRSRGLPLFTEQLAGHADVDQPLPALLSDLLGQRVRDLAEDEEAVVRTLAVADRPLPATVLGEVSALPEAGLTRALRRLDALRLLAVTSPDVALRHPLLAEAVRHDLVGDEAALLHRSLADALAGVPGAEPAEIATHWQAAAAPERELPWRLRAAQVALARGATLEAADQWSRALAIWPTQLSASGDPPTSRADIQLAAIELLDDVGQKTRAFQLLDDLLEQADSLPPLQRAAAYCAAALHRAQYEDVSAGLAGAAAAVEALAEQPASGPHADILLRYSSALIAAGREDEGVAARDRALEVAREIGDAVRERSVLINLVGKATAQRDLDRARAEIASAWALHTPQPHPLGDVRLGTQATDLVLRSDGGPDEMEAAGRLALRVIDAWGIDSGAASTVKSNMAHGLWLHGRVRRAAELIGDDDLEPAREGDGRLLDRWPLHLQRVALDVIRGRLDDALARARVIDALPITALAVEPEITEVLAQAELWAHRPEDAAGRLARFFGAAAPVEWTEWAGGCVALAARAAADLPGLSSGRRRELVEEMRALPARLRVDPFLPGPIPGDGLTWKATWHAELNRLAGGLRPDLWVVAAAAWDARSRPFDAAYCRWRGAQAAVASGHRALARQLLDEAARDAREHVPLTDAVRRTATSLARPAGPTGAAGDRQRRRGLDRR